MQLSHTYQSLPTTFYSAAIPTAAEKPFVAIYNTNLAASLGILLSDSEIAQYLSGLLLPPSAQPIAMAYAGHQFGHFTMLGDGRAILLGEILDAENNRFDLQLKGSGATPYSRRGDGKAAISSALREYIYSESMHALGISTTRSLAVIGTGAAVYRQVAEPGAVLTRLAHSHIRFGTFEYAARFGNLNDLQALLQYTIQRHYPQLIDAPNQAQALLQIVIENQMKLVVQWMRVGFIHGVLNTDNISISGQTLDYGPCAFMNDYNPKTVYSQIDTNGRYAFGQQPSIMHWNCVRFAETLIPLLHTDQTEAIAIATAILNKSNLFFETEYMAMLHAKIGIDKAPTKPIEFVGKLLNWMQVNNADYTNTFLQLMGKKIPENKLYQSPSWLQLIAEWENTLAENKTSLQDAIGVMQKNNPNYIPRNTNIDALINDYLQTADSGKIQSFLQTMQSTYSTAIEDINLCNYIPENGFSTHCNT